MSWQSILIEDACEKIIDYRGKTPKKSDSGVRLVTAKVIKGGRINDEPAEYISETEYDRWMTRGIPVKGDVLLTTEAPLGEVAILRTDEKVALAQRSILLRADKKKLENEFLLYVLQSPLVQGRLHARATGTTVMGIKNKELRKVEIPLPTIEEQKSIAKKLADVDDLIENNRRRIQLLEETARLLYKEWFVHLRFPGHEHVKITDGVPEGWNVKKLTEIAIVNERSLKKGFDGEIEYVDIASVSPNAINETTWYEFSEAPGRARRVLKHKDIIWSCVRPNRRSHAFVWMPHDRLIASTGFAVISSKNISPCYLYQYLTTNDYVGYLTNNAGGAAYPAVTAKVFEKSKILVPDEKLQVEFEEFVEVIFQEKQLLSDQIKKLAEARDILLPRLMNGELTV